MDEVLDKTRTKIPRKSVVESEKLTKYGELT
jgi:hypothetical protein